MASDSIRPAWIADDVAMAQVSEGSWLTASDLGALRSIGTRRAIPAGTTIFMEGDEANDLMIVESGSIKITTSALTGDEVVLEVLGAGELLGELSVIDGTSRSATAVAIDAVELTTITAERFLEFLRDRPMAMGVLLAVVVRRLRMANRRQLEYSAVDALGRVCARIDEMATRYGTSSADGTVRIDLQMTQTELAQWCGLSREAVVKALRKLRNLGWIQTDEGMISIVDRAKIANRGAL